MCDGDFRADFQALAGPEAVETSVADDPAAIGFSSSAQRATDIRALVLIRQAGEAAVALTVPAIHSGRYPLARTLEVIINIPPGRSTKPALQAFLVYVRSPAGEAVAARAEYVPLPRK